MYSGETCLCINPRRGCASRKFKFISTGAPVRFCVRRGGGARTRLRDTSSRYSLLRDFAAAAIHVSFILHLAHMEIPGNAYGIPAHLIPFPDDTTNTTVHSTHETYLLHLHCSMYEFAIPAFRKRWVLEISVLVRMSNFFVYPREIMQLSLPWALLDTRRMARVACGGWTTCPGYANFPSAT